MNYGQFLLFRKYKLTSKLINSVSEVVNKIKNYKTPERLKGTIIERWGIYWKHFYVDYADVARDIAKNYKERPVRSSIYTSLLAFCIYMSKHNPDESSFREDLLQNTMKVMQVGEPIRNPISEQHVKWVEQCYNEGIVRHLNVGIISIIWLDNYDKICSLYKAVCPYLKPQYVTFHERVIDVGFLDKWWILESKMKDYDVNEAEFSDCNI